MNNVKYGFFALTTALITAGGASAATFSILGGGSYHLSPGTTGQLQIQYDPTPQGNIAFAKGIYTTGEIGLIVGSSQPDVIKFIGATIVETQARWNASGVIGLSPDSVGELFTYSVSSPGLPVNAVSTFAIIDYEVIDFGSTTLSLGLRREDPLIDGNLGDVSHLVQLIGANFSNNPIPEPGSIVLATIGIAAVVLRRRNG